MRAALITVARRAAVVASRQAAAPRTALFFQAVSARRPVDFSLRTFQTNEEVVEEVNKAPEGKLYAVDAPDGEHDMEDLEEHKKGVEDIINFAANNEDPNAINAVHAAGSAKAFAVDAPDGEHDLEDVEEHGQQVSSFIDDAAKMEDPDEIKRQQELRGATLAEAERHPEKDM
eukprot:CAMPEP_0197433180 /NCGR_PEP_ID=MMETSP1175-20131217/1117_1 /TAXON_ID=1003142 /ORGANISM="Triceratium dubium, Strain CCMP147" /LENGTH=172 /DNA_ID=CAMNT_0042961481 /DNA_START=190 /DNA_END=708 /DNA_ORIENTATION=+